MSHVTATVHRGDATSTIVVRAKPGWTPDQWDEALDAHVGRQVSPLAWDTYTEADGTDCWVITYKAGDVAA